MSLSAYINSEFHFARSTEFSRKISQKLTIHTTLKGKVLVITVDGRTLLGTLLSTDQLTNLVLSQTVERIIRTPDDPEPSSEIEHGLYLIRGDNVVICGEVDEAIDGDIDWGKVKGEVIRGTKNL